jgi:hypothetical protein
MSLDFRFPIGYSDCIPDVKGEHMARLLIKAAEAESRSIELKLGANRLGRSPDADFQIANSTVSSFHCELILTNEGVTIRDLESTNGTFVNGNRVREANLVAGQTVRLGEVELVVETTDTMVAIPKFVDIDAPAPPVVLSDGSLLCPRHPQSRVTHQCGKCKEVMCDACVHRLRRKGGKTLLLLCPVCSGPVAVIGDAPKPKRKSFLARLEETVKLKLTRSIDLRK